MASNNTAVVNSSNVVPSGTNSTTKPRAQKRSAINTETPESAPTPPKLSSNDNEVMVSLFSS